MAILQAVVEPNDLDEAVSPSTIPLSFHPSFFSVYRKLDSWMRRFPLLADSSLLSDLSLLYLLASKKYLDHRTPAHLFRLTLSIHFMQKMLLRLATFSSHQRHLEIRWIHAELVFPFFSKPVLGCLIGLNMMDRYELFDEENVLLALRKYFPQFRIVKESSYSHTSQHKNLRMFYLEIEKIDGKSFSLSEQQAIKGSLEGKIRQSIQRLSPVIFMGINEEEVYKNILILSQEIHALHDLPQAHITLDQQTGKEIVFRVILVHIAPFHRFSLRERFFDCRFVPERVATVKKIDNHPVEAHIFRLHLSRDSALLRSDGSLDFYAARQKVASLILFAVGEFRDYNGGILVKQQELVDRFKKECSERSYVDQELAESFFYALTPLEKQVLLPSNLLMALFSCFMESRKGPLEANTAYRLDVFKKEGRCVVVAYGEDSSFRDVVVSTIDGKVFQSQDLAYNFIDTDKGTFFNGLFLSQSEAEVDSSISTLQGVLQSWQETIRNRQILRIGCEQLAISLDPRIGGEAISAAVLKLLFEGLTRINPDGSVGNGVAESIEISPDQKEYLFKLRSVQWNDGSFVSAYDFEYAWKKVLSPDFKTAFAHLFYPIAKAREAKRGEVSLNEVGIHVINDRTLKVILGRPVPYFLQLIALPVFSPVHRLVDLQYPQWPYQTLASYPCNGPFQLKINHATQGYHLIRNPLYWDLNRISWDQITMTQMQPSQALQAFYKKEIDWIGSPLSSWHPSYVPREGDQVISFHHRPVSWLVFNTTSPFFQNLKLRQAFAYAIDRKKLVLGSFVPIDPAYSPLPLRKQEERKGFFPERDLQKAKQLLQEALQELGLERLPPFELLFLSGGVREHTAESLQKQLREALGLECITRAISFQSIFRCLERGDFSVSLFSWTSWIDDPTYILNNFRFSNEEINFSRWEESEFQGLLDASDQEVNPFQRSSFLLKAEELLSREMPVIPLFYQSMQTMVRKELQVMCQDAFGPIDWSNDFYKHRRFHYVNHD